MTEASAIVAFAIVFMALAFTISAYALRNVGLVMAGAIAWVVLLADSYSLSTYFSTGVTDVWFAMVWLSVGMVLVCALEPVIMKSKPKERLLDETISETLEPSRYKTIEEDIDEKDDDEDSRDIERDYRRTRAGTHTIRAVREGRKRQSKFARTGVINGR